jgi:cytochrome c553
MYRIASFLAFVVSLSPAIGRAAAPAAPHDKSFSEGDCERCHSLSAVTATGAVDFSAGCIACHLLQTGSQRRFPNVADEAKPGLSGSHHGWTGYAENPAVGATKPPGLTQQAALVDGRLQCAACHNVKVTAPSSMNPDSRHTRVTLLPGPAGATLTLADPGTSPRGFRFRIQTQAGSAGTFIFTREGYVATPQWWNWNGTGWVPGSVTGPGRPYSAGSPTPVVDTDDLRISWSAAAAVGAQWDVLVSYPGSRYSVVGGTGCVICHKSMDMRTARVAGSDASYQVDGVRMFSHPVGEGLNANGLGTDQTEVLAPDGLPQSTSTDTNQSNRLNLYAGTVRCTTCHAVHGADSNSLTDDAAQ